MMYPARVKKEDVGFYAVFVDFPNAFTQADSMGELAENTRDVLSMAIKHLLDKDREVPKPSEVTGDDIILVEPYPEIRQRLGHKKGCECPVCRNARGERTPKRRRIDITMDNEIIEKLKAVAKNSDRTVSALIESAIKEKYLQ
ncbi:MAG: type II toxin-antitoxin system HicB family antitoxin [Candidatus Eremiobacteraeota bacterium]|nr:type II toxin-antitoxin system HicB family antitoxin [Candidatus Eremiobacteraeota bacterium]